MLFIFGIYINCFFLTLCFYFVLFNVHICVCMYVCLYVCVYACMCVYVCMYNL
jgi:hypothetical protein